MFIKDYQSRQYLQEVITYCTLQPVTVKWCIGWLSELSIEHLLIPNADNELIQTRIDQLQLVFRRTDTLDRHQLDNLIALLDIRVRYYRGLLKSLMNVDYQSDGIVDLGYATDDFKYIGEQYSYENYLYNDGEVAAMEDVLQDFIDLISPKIELK